MASGKNENGVNAFVPYLKPPDKTAWEKITTTLYDKSENTILGRTPKNWGQLLIFYTIFYAVLAALWAICLQGLFATLNDRSPKWTLDSSLIGTNPGMGFRPISNNTDEGSLIWYDSKNATSIMRWVTYLNEFLREYQSDAPKPNQVVCDFNKPPGDGKTCEVNLKDFRDCSPDNDFGYNTSSPCVYLKLNRIYGWVPDYYNDPEKLPQEMPEDLVADIKREYATDPLRANQVWISCQGEQPVDQEHITSKFEYFPTRGFPGFYYPFTNADNYQSPLIAVKLKNPKPNVIVSIECRAWAKNIVYVGGNRDREGSVHFEIMRDA